MFSRILLIACLILSLAATAVAAEPTTLHFGIISTASPQTLKKRWEPLLADMQKSIGIKVQAFYAPNYAGVIEAMRTNKVQVAWFGNKSAIEAVDHAHGEVFAQAVPLDGNAGYHSHLIVHKDSALNSLEDVLKNAKKLSFGNGDPNSTSGFLVPNYYAFAKQKVDPKLAFKSVVNASHEGNSLAVANKQVDVATSNSVHLQNFEKAFPEKRVQLKVVWTSPLIPSDALVWRADLPDKLKGRVKDMILAYGVKGQNVEKEKPVLTALSWAYFRASDNDQLLPVRQLELFKTRTRVETDASLAPAEKAQQLAKIDAKLDEMQSKIKR